MKTLELDKLMEVQLRGDIITSSCKHSDLSTQRLDGRSRSVIGSKMCRLMTKR